MSVGQGWRRLRALRWGPWALVGIAALAWWYYAAPIQLAKRIRSSVEETSGPDASSLLSSRVDFARINAHLSGDLRGATDGRLDEEGFSHLLLHGWLPQQRRKPGVGGKVESVAESEPIPGDVLVGAEKTRLHVVRYRSLNRFMAIFWDAGQVHQVVLTLQREGPLHRWHVTRVNQFNTCAYDFDCVQVPLADLSR